MPIDRINHIPELPRELNPEEKRAQTIARIKGQISLAAQWLDFLVTPLPNDHMARKIHVDHTFLVDKQENPITDDDGQQVKSRHYKLWTKSMDFRILQDGQLARNPNLPNYEKFVAKGGDESYVVDVTTDFYDEQTYRQDHLDDLAEQLDKLSGKLQNQQEVPVDNTLNLF